MEGGVGSDVAGASPAGSSVGCWGEGWGILGAPHAHPQPAGASACLVPSVASATTGRMVSLCWHLHAEGPGPRETWKCAGHASGVTANGQEGCGCRLSDGDREVTKPRRRSWELGSRGNHFHSLSTGFALGCERVPGVSQDWVWGNTPASSGHLRTCFPAEALAPVEAQRGQRECSAGRKFLRLSLSCLISASRTRLFWKHVVNGEKPTKERRQGG